MPDKRVVPALLAAAALAGAILLLWIGRDAETIRVGKSEGREAGGATETFPLRAHESPEAARAPAPAETLSPPEDGETAGPSASEDLEPLTGRVEAEETGDPIEGAEVELWRLEILMTFRDLEQGEHLKTVRTDADGAFETRAPPLGCMLYLRVSAPGRITAWHQPFFEEAGAPIRLKAATRVRGVVAGPGNEAIPEALVGVAPVDRLHNPIPFQAPPETEEDIRLFLRFHGAILSGLDGAFDIDTVPVDEEVVLVGITPGGVWDCSASFVSGSPGVVRNRDLVIRGVADLEIEVVDAAGEPIEGVEIGLWRGLRDPVCRRTGGPFEERTDGRGRARFEKVPAGRIVLMLMKSGVRPFTRPVDLEPGSSRTLRIEAPPCLSISGTILNRKGDPLPRGHVVAWPEKVLIASPYYKVNAGKDGTFRVEGLPAGKARITVGAPGYAEHRRTVTAGEAGLRIALVPVPVFRGRIAPADPDLPPDRVQLAVFWKKGHRTYPARLDKEGVFSIPWDRYPEGSAEVKVASIAPGRTPVVRGPFRPKPGETVELGLLEPVEGRTLRGKIENPEGMPMKGLQVSFGFHRWTLLHTKTREDGSFAIENVPRWAGWLRAGHHRYPNAKRRVPPEGEGPFTLTFLPPAILTGLLLDPGGEPCPICKIHIHRVYEDGTTGTCMGACCQTDRDGRFRSGPMGPGRHRLIVCWPDYGHTYDGFEVVMRKGEKREVVVRIPSIASGEGR